MTRPAATLRALPLLAVPLAFLAGCAGSDPQPLEPISLDRFGGADSLLSGGGGSSVLGYTAPTGSLLPAVRLVGHDAANPDVLRPLGDVSFPGGTRISRLQVTDEAAALVLDGGVWVVDLADPSLAVWGVAVGAAALDVAVSGRWVAVAVEHGLVLSHRDDPFAPHPFTASGTPGALLAAGTTFLAFTTTGYVVADASGAVPAFHEVTDPELGNLRAAIASGDTAVAAGPGSTPDRTRVLWLDLADPTVPVVVRRHELPGAFVALASDGAGAAVVAIHGEGDTATPTAFHQGYVLRESGGGLQVAGLSLAFWSESEQPLAAHAGHLFAVEGVGLGHLRIR